ncbi:MAG: hypothetical protein II453_01855 [Alphaproteobacteria bacterium]|nr:hypothetical protein [Alphaproteobacteria bacterium]
MEQISNFPGYYITSAGNIYTRNYDHTGRIKKLKTGRDTKGYLRVNLYKNSKRIQQRVHRLVAETFIPNPAMCCVGKYKTAGGYQWKHK